MILHSLNWVSPFESLGLMENCRSHGLHQRDCFNRVRDFRDDSVSVDNRLSKLGAGAYAARVSMRANLRGPRRRVPPNDQREVQRPVHLGEQPPHRRPRRPVRGAAAQDGLYAAQDQPVRHCWCSSCILLLVSTTASITPMIPHSNYLT